MGIGSDNSEHPKPHTYDEVSIPVSYPHQFAAIVKGIAEYFHELDIPRITELTEGQKLPDGKYLYLNKDNNELTFRLIDIHKGKPLLHTQDMAYVLFMAQTEHKFPDVNDSQVAFRLKTNSPHFPAISQIIQDVQDTIPPPPSVHFITDKQLAAFSTKVQKAFADSGQEVSVRQRNRDTGDSGITTSTFHVDTNDGKVLIARADTHGKTVRLRIPQTSPEAEEAEHILRSITGPDHDPGPPKRLRSVSEVKLGAKHVVTTAHGTYNRIGYKPAPASALANSDLHDRLYAYDPEADILKDEQSLHEFKRQVRAGKWKPARSDLKQLHLRHTDTPEDKDREFDLRRRELYPERYRPDAEVAPPKSWIKQQLEQWVEKEGRVPTAPTTTDEMLRMAVEKFNGKSEQDKGRS